MTDRQTVFSSILYESWNITYPCHNIGLFYLANEVDIEDTICKSEKHREILLSLSIKMRPGGVFCDHSFLFPRFALTCKFFGQNDAMCPTIREILITDHLKSAKRHLPQMLREMSGNKRRAFAARTDNR